MLNEGFFWGSVLAALVLACFAAVRRRSLGALLWAVAIIGAFLALLLRAGVVFLPLAEGPVARGGGEERQGALVLLLYLAMLAGMLSHYLYARFDGPPKQDRRFDLGRLLAPVFVSPIVFLPLASIFETSGATQAKASHLMLFLVAFENGFFWREFFENRLKTHTAGASR